MGNLMPMGTNNWKRMKDELVLKMVEDGQLPQRLFKYRSLSNEYTLDIFRKCELYFSAPKDFNDPFDCKFLPVIESQKDFASVMAQRQTLDYDKEEVRNKIEEKDGLIELVTKAVDNVMNRKGICCFAKKDTEILMWSHYADNHKGICLGFDVREDPGFFVFPMIIDYTENYPKVDVSRKNGMDNYVTTLLKNKYLGWAYEDEVRVYKPSPKVYSFHPKALKSVIFGCKADEVEIEKVKKAVSENPNLHHVEFYKATVDENEYKLNIERLDDVAR